MNEIENFKVKDQREKNSREDNNEFMKKLFYISTDIISNSEFEKQGLKNRNLIFFLNYVIEILSSTSMLGSRVINGSLIGKIDGIIEYSDNIKKQSENADKNTKTIPKYRIEYVRNAIKNNNFITEQARKKYLNILGDDKDQVLIENIKLIRISLIDSKYFETISDELYEMILNADFEIQNLDRIADLSNEYFALLTDYIGISTFEIKKVIKDLYHDFFESHKENVFLKLFEKFKEPFKKENLYHIVIKIDKKFDDKLIKVLRQIKNNDYKIYKKTGLVKKFNSLKITNQRVSKKINDKFDLVEDECCYLYSEIKSKDIWKAIKLFRQKIVQPFIGTMLYSGINLNTSGKYIVIENKESKKFINEYVYHDDIFKPLSQLRRDYSNVFKRYIIEENENDINKVIDESVQLLPYYKTSESTLTKFTNTWFALETLFRNASDTISNSLEEYASSLVADRMLSGYIYLTAYQINQKYYKFGKKSNNFVENNFKNFESHNNEDCDFLDWKFKKVKEIATNYEAYFNKYYNEAKELLMDAYYLRNKQFHGTKDSQLEMTTGFLYDIVNDAISYYIDYIDVYRSSDKNLKSLFNYIKNIKKIKMLLISETSEHIDRLIIIYDAVRKL